jgi:hypothetical protein
MFQTTNQNNSITWFIFRRSPKKTLKLRESLMISIQHRIAVMSPDPDFFGDPFLDEVHKPRDGSAPPIVARCLGRKCACFGQKETDQCSPSHWTVLFLKKIEKDPSDDIDMRNICVPCIPNQNQNCGIFFCETKRPHDTQQICITLHTLVL